MPTFPEAPLHQPHDFAPPAPDITAAGLPKRTAQVHEGDTPGTRSFGDFADVNASIHQTDFSPVRQVHQAVAEARYNGDAPFFEQLHEHREKGVPLALQGPLSEVVSSGNPGQLQEALAYLDKASAPNMESIVHRNAPPTSLVSALHKSFSATNQAMQEKHTDAPQAVEQELDERARKIAAAFASTMIADQVESPEGSAPQAGNVTAALGEEETVELPARVIATVGEVRPGRHRRATEPGRHRRREGTGRADLPLRPAVPEAAPTAPPTRDTTVRSHRRRPGIGQRLKHLKNKFF